MAHKKLQGGKGVGLEGSVSLGLCLTKLQVACLSLLHTLEIGGELVCGFYVDADIRIGLFQQGLIRGCHLGRQHGQQLLAGQ